MRTNFGQTVMSGLLNVNSLQTQRNNQKTKNRFPQMYKAWSYS